MPPKSSRPFIILDPCPKPVSELLGGGRERFCPTCQRTVHALEHYSRAEWQQVLRRSKGRVCGFMASQVEEVPRSRRAVLFGALLSFLSPLFGQSGRVRIKVSDASGAVLPSATVSLLDGDEPVLTVQCDEAGEVRWDVQALGPQRFRVTAAGFKTKVITANVTPDGETRTEVVLEVAPSDMGGPVVPVDFILSTEPAEPYRPVRQPDLPVSPAKLPAPKILKKHWWHK